MRGLRYSAVATREKPTGKLSKSAYARAVGARRATIGEACKKGGPLYDAFNQKPGHAGRIDADHPAALRYAAKYDGRAPRSEAPQGRGRIGMPNTADRKAQEAHEWQIQREKWRKDIIEDNKKAKKPKKPEKLFSPTVVDVKKEHLPEDIRKVLDWTVRDIVDVHGDVPSFDSILKATKLIAEIDARRTNTARVRGELIDREFVRQHLVAAIDDTTRRILQDSPRTIATRVRSLAISGAGMEKLEEAVLKILSKQIQGMKKKAQKGLQLSRAQSRARGSDADAEI